MSGWLSQATCSVSSPPVLLLPVPEGYVFGCVCMSICMFVCVCNNSIGHAQISLKLCMFVVSGQNKKGLRETPVSYSGKNFKIFVNMPWWRFALYECFLVVCVAMLSVVSVWI